MCGVGVFTLKGAEKNVVVAGELTFPVRPSSEVPTRGEPSFRVRRRTAAELPPHMVGETLFEAYRTPLLQFVADWNRSPSKVAMIEEAPSYEGPDRYLLPSIAAVVHALADRASLTVPEWVWEHRLAEDWVLLCEPGEHESFFWKRAMEQAPPTCVHHRVFFHPRILDKGTPDWWLPWT